MLDFSVTFVITIINIVILFFILKAVLFKRVTKFMADRARRFQDQIDQIEEEKAKAKKMLAEYETKLKAAETEAGLILNKAREDACGEAARIVAEGKVKAEAQLEAARTLAETERQAAYARFRIDAAALVMAASARLVRRELTGGDNKVYADMLLDELASRKGSA